MATIEYNIIGESNFLRDRVYCSGIFNFLEQFEDKFKLADNVIINFEDIINPNSNNPVPNELTVSDDGTRIKLVFKSSRYYQANGNMSKPGVNDFFQRLGYYLTNTVVLEDNKRYDSLNTLP